MTDYDFRILQPNEFECLSRDLLQSREKIFIESFADGRDKGIDLRFAYSKDKSCIIQCKRYKEWKELKGKLKIEVEKVRQLQPQRYILTTSVDLTVEQKDVIVSMFTPFILAKTDILSRKDLNNLLAQHPEIEYNYNKLWLASTNVLNKIINSATLNWSSFELEKIKTDIRLYVENQSFNKALEILTENHYVIISGIPGIGKTTLARMLVYTMLAHGYEEFVYVTDDMDNAAKMFNRAKRQVFFFDDFLGSNSFIQQSVGFENKLITFIDKVRESDHTVFILATREYVLSEAKTHYEKLSLNNIDIAKCTIELEYYTKTIKARILYNHLAEANIPAKYIDEFLEKRSYHAIINHHNFNPRVIEAIIKEQIWNSIDAGGFANKVKGFFDNPISVWQFAFEKLDIETRYILLVLGTMGNLVRLDDLQEAYRQFLALNHHELGLAYDDVKWKHSLKVLMNCFIKIESSNMVKLVSMYNPSIADFIVFYLNQNHTTTGLLLRGVCFIEQLYHIFTDNREYAVKNHIVYVDEDIISEIEMSFMRAWGKSCSCQLKNRYLYGADRVGFSETRVLYEFRIMYPRFCKKNEGFVEKLYNVDELTWQSNRLSFRIGLMSLLDWSYLPSKKEEFIRHIIENETLDTDEWIELVVTIRALKADSEVVDSFVYKKLTEDLKSEIERFSDQGECDEEWEKIEELKEMLPGWEYYDVADTIEMKEESIKNEADEQDAENEEPYYKKWVRESEREDAQIDEMFSALRS